VLIPASAVQDENGVQVVYVQTGGESFERRIVRIGSATASASPSLPASIRGSVWSSKGAYLIRLSTSRRPPSATPH
jgi:cobalt-zinc-cadmium efflux system membrane fusion protein